MLAGKIISFWYLQISYLIVIMFKSLCSLYFMFYKNLSSKRKLYIFYVVNRNRKVVYVLTSSRLAKC